MKPSIHNQILEKFAEVLRIENELLCAKTSFEKSFWREKLSDAYPEFIQLLRDFDFVPRTAEQELRSQEAGKWSLTGSF